MWAATCFLDNEDVITVEFREFAISHKKQVVSDLLQQAKEVTCEEKLKLDKRMFKCRQ